MIRATQPMPHQSNSPVSLRSAYFPVPGSRFPVPGLIALLLVASACTASSDEVRPPAEQLFFPTGMAVSPDEGLLFVASANSELRYDSGSLSVIDLALVDAVVASWQAGQVAEGCAGDLDFTETLVCDEAPFIIDGAGVRTGNFATAVAIQDLGAGRLRLMVPVRGDPSVTWMEWDPTTSQLLCDDGAEGFSLCDDAHRLTQLRDDPSLPRIPDEPFGAYADAAGQFAMVTHLTSGAVTLIDSRSDRAPILAEVIAGLFATDPSTGFRGATAVAARTPGGLVYVTSRSEDRVQLFAVDRIGDGLAQMIPTDYFFLNGVGNNAGSSRDTRGLAFDDTGDRMVLVNRSPPSVQVYDTSLGPSGLPENRLLAAGDLCRDPSQVAVANVGDGPFAYASCFSEGEVWATDTRAGAQLAAVTQVGRGPYAVVAAPGRGKLFVSNFLEDTIAVIDVAESSPDRFRVVLRIGRPKQ